MRLEIAECAERAALHGMQIVGLASGCSCRHSHGISCSSLPTSSQGMQSSQLTYTNTQQTVNQKHQRQHQPACNQIRVHW